MTQKLSKKAVVAMQMSEHIKKLGLYNGQLACWLCEDGIVAWRIASSGHSSGRCSTPGCVAWIE